MIIIVLVNIVMIIYIYANYYKSKITENYKKETIEEINPMIIGYINDKKINNNFDLILAEIIHLNIKGLLTIEYDADKINKYNYKLKANFDFETEDLEKYELIILQFLFSKKTEITKEELEEKLRTTFNSYSIQYNDLYKILKENLIKQNIIDEAKNDEVEKISKNYGKYAVIIFIIGIILNIGNSLLYINIYIIQCIIIKLMLEKANNYTEKGDILRKQVSEYKAELEKKEFLLDNVTMNEIVLNKEFPYSLALHINTEAKKAFVDERIVPDAMKASKKASMKVIILFIIVIFAEILLSKITMQLGRSGIIMLYSTMSLIIAAVADIVMMLGTAKKTK